jgi:hypothetical protein
MIKSHENDGNYNYRRLEAMRPSVHIPGEKLVSLRDKRRTQKVKFPLDDAPRAANHVRTDLLPKDER